MFHAAAAYVALSITVASTFGLGADEKSKAGRAPRWKFEKGATIAYDFERNFKFTLPGVPSPAQVLKVSARCSFLEVDSDGTAAVSFAVERVQMEIQGIPEMEFHYDSEKREESAKLPQGEADLVKMLELLRAAPLQFKVSTAGEITNFVVPRDLAAAMKRKPSAFVELGALLSANGLERLVKEIFVTLPADPVKVGDNWQQVLPLQGSPKWTYQDDLTYRGPKTGGAPKHLVEMKRTVKVEEGDSPQDQESKGELVFDTSTGRLEQFDLRHKMRVVTSTLLQDGGGKRIKRTQVFESIDKVRRRTK